MILAAAVILSFVAQWILGMPSLPTWAQGIMIPMVWIVAPPMRHHSEHVFVIGLGLGLAWDLLFEPVVGPGAIAWSAAALIVAWTVRRIGEHSALSWGLLGAGGALLVVAFRVVVQAPLGMASPPSPLLVATGALGTGLWCSWVAWILGMDLPGRIRRYRRSRLR